MENQTPNSNNQLTPKQKKVIWITTFVVTFIAVFAIVFFSMRGCSVSNEKLELSDIKMTTSYNEYLGYTVKITGTAKNVSGRSLSYASVEFSIYDSAGNNLGTALDNINNLGKGDTWRFEATLFSFPKVQPTAWKLADINAW